jgi:hypothetical protein
MLFTELSSILYPTIADAFANLPKKERIKKALKILKKNSRLILRRARLIYNICHTTLL